MDRNYKFLKTGTLRVIFLLLLVFFIQSACCHNQVPVVVVREYDLRFGPESVPLNDNTRDALEKYIKAGGDKNKTGPIEFYLINKTFYKTLLTHFSRLDKKANVQDFFSKNKGLYRLNYQGFQEPIIYDIIDATQKRPASEKNFSPLAVSDGHLVWIFYRDENDNIIKLMLTLPYNKKIIHYRNN